MVKKIEVLKFFHRSEKTGLPVDNQALREHFDLTPCNTSNWIKRLLDQKLINCESDFNTSFCTYVLTEKGINKLNWKNKGAITKKHLVVNEGAKTLVENVHKPEKGILDEIHDFLFED